MSPLDGIRHLLASHSHLSSVRKQQGQGIEPDPRFGDRGMYNYYGQDPNMNTVVPNTDPYYTPYLGLRARLSQTWINRWTILLLLIILRILLSLAEIDANIAQAKTEALSACTSVETIGSAMASMPHYLSQGVNHLAADGITKAVNGLMEMLLLSITGVEEIVLFVIHMMTSTYMCLITLAVSGSLQAAIEMIETVGDFMNKSISAITGDVASGLKDFQDSLNTFLTSINIGGILSGGSSTPPTIDLSGDIAKLNDIQIDPSQMDAELTKLNNSLPTFDQVQNFTDNIIKLPFEEVKKLINKSMETYTFDDSVFPIPKKEALTFCSDNTAIQDFFVGLVKTIATAKKILLVVLILAAILACIPMAFREIFKWRSMQQRAAMLSRGHFDNMDVLYITTRPYTAGFGIRFASRFRSPKRQVLVRWFIAYTTSVPALFVLALGLAGLFTCLCQFLVLKTIEREVPALAAEVGDFANTVVLALNNASEQWAVGANAVINDTNTQINHDVFGWVNTTTKAVNDSLNAFSDEMTKALNDTFGGTVLYKPILGVFECLVGLKIAGVEKGLTWVSDHAHVEFPEFNKEVFSLGAAAALTNGTGDDSFLASPGSETQDEVTGAVEKVVAKLIKVIVQEMWIAGGLVACWGLVVLMGLGRVLMGWWGREKVRGEGGGRVLIPSRGAGRSGEKERESESRGTDADGISRAFPRFGEREPETARPDMGEGGDWRGVPVQPPPSYLPRERLEVGNVGGGRNGNSGNGNGIGRVRSEYGELRYGGDEKRGW
ncbi:plasma membrane fusion prm1 protein [Rutstroemia sp. NJR-2017a BVV2]|nr:plasma membrane fusion prm1 protein [Rutstroemia sp. NJR-2017a BVV2]